MKAINRPIRPTIVNCGKHCIGELSGPAAGPHKAWLGAAVAIKEPTAATFARHAGSNLLVVGAWEESALGVMANAVIALAAQNAHNAIASERAGPSSAPAGGEQDRSAGVEDGPARKPAMQFYILDGTRPESPQAGSGSAWSAHFRTRSTWAARATRPA